MGLALGVPVEECGGLQNWKRVAVSTSTGFLEGFYEGSKALKGDFLRVQWGCHEGVYEGFCKDSRKI